MGTRSNALSRGKRTDGPGRWTKTQHSGRPCKWALDHSECAHCAHVYVHSSGEIPHPHLMCLFRIVTINVHDVRAIPWRRCTSVRHTQQSPAVTAANLYLLLFSWCTLCRASFHDHCHVQLLQQAAAVNLTSPACGRASRIHQDTHSSRCSLLLVRLKASGINLCA